MESRCEACASNYVHSVIMHALQKLIASVANLVGKASVKSRFPDKHDVVNHR